MDSERATGRRAHWHQQGPELRRRPMVARREVARYYAAVTQFVRAALSTTRDRQKYPRHTERYDSYSPVGRPTASGFYFLSDRRSNRACEARGGAATRALLRQADDDLRAGAHSRRAKSVSQDDELRAHRIPSPTARDIDGQRAEGRHPDSEEQSVAPATRPADRPRRNRGAVLRSPPSRRTMALSQPMANASI